ncbi:glycosyltransferase [bacterium]|nr:glycosyltransferase [bacterium]
MGKRKKIKVLQLIEGFHLGGAEKKLLELVKHLDGERFQTTVCSLNMGNEIQDQFHNLKNFGISVEVIPRTKKIDIGLIFKLAKYIRSQQIDLIMTTLFYADVVGLIAGRLAGVKASFSWETISSPEWLYQRRLWAYRYAIQYCTKVIAVSQATAQFLIDKRGVNPGKIIIIPYGVDLNLFSDQKDNQIRQELGIGEQKYIIGMIGRLHPQKGHIYLIEAAQKVVQKKKEAFFVIVGDGKLRDFLENEVKNKNLSEHFLFTGFRNDIPQLLKCFNIFILPSLYEGLPNVILEAMATGIPVIATNVDGSREAVINQKTGILLPAKNSSELARSIQRLIENPDIAKKMGENGRKRVEEHFSLEKQVRTFESLFERYS